MPLIRILVAIACCLLAAGHGEEIEVVLTSSKAADKADGVATTKLTPSVEEPKSKTEKRDSADQTGPVFPGPSSSKEPPFRPIYPSAGSYFEAATAETQTPIFGPTTVRYTAAEAAPQSFYERKPPALQYSHQGAAPHHRFSFAVPPQVALYQRPAGIKPPIFNYGELEQEPTQPQVQHQHHHSHSKYLQQQQQQQQQQHQPQPPQEPPKLQQRIQYIIAIPLSYMRQLQQQQQQQQQLISGSGSSSTSTTSTAAPLPSTRHPLVQLLGPLARDHQGLYRPFYQSDAASAPSAGPAVAQQQPYLQIPTSVLLAAAQQLQQHHHQQHQQQAASYAKAQSPAPPSAASYQPQPQYIYPQAQLQLQRIFLQPPHPQTPTIYAEQQPGQLYAYPLQHQHQQQQQQHQQQQHHLKQSQQQQQQHKYTPAAPTAATTSTTSQTATAAAAAATSEAAAAATATRQQHLPVVHYNPVYVQAPAEHQQQQQQHQFSILPRFSNNNPKGYESVGPAPAPAPAPVPIHLVRLSPMGNGPPIHHYHHYQPASLLQPFQYHPQQQQQQYLSPYAEDGPKSGSGTILAGPTPVPGMTAASPAIIPYFSHPGAVHYGTHLYHPGAVSAVGASSAGVAVSPGVGASSPKQQSTATSGGQLPGGSNNIVKYP